MPPQQTEEDKPQNRSIIPDRMLPAFHRMMVVVALSAIFCISGVLANLFMMKGGQLPGVKGFWIVFIIGGIIGTASVWSWRYKKTKEEK